MCPLLCKGSTVLKACRQLLAPPSGTAQSINSHQTLSNLFLYHSLHIFSTTSSSFKRPHKFKKTWRKATLFITITVMGQKHREIQTFNLGAVFGLYTASLSPHTAVQWKNICFDLMCVSLFSCDILNFKLFIADSNPTICYHLYSRNMFNRGNILHIHKLLSLAEPLQWHCLLPYILPT